MNPFGVLTVSVDVYSSPKILSFFFVFLLMTRKREKRETGEIIKKDNKLVEARYSLPVNAQRLLSVLSLKFSENDDKFHKHSFELSEIYKLFNVSEQNKRVRRAALEKALDALLKNLVKIDNIVNGKHVTLISAWIESPVIHWDDSRLVLRGAEHLKPFFLNLKGFFTSYSRQEVLSFKNPHSLRFLEICKNYQPRPDYHDAIIDGKYINKKYFTINALRRFLKISKKNYKKTANFKTRILEAAQKEVNEKTSACFEFEMVKDPFDRRKTTGVELIIFGPYVSSLPSPPEPDQEEILLGRRMAELGVSEYYQDLIFIRETDRNRVRSALEAVEDWKRIGKIKLKFPGPVLLDAIRDGWISNRETARRLDREKEEEKLDAVEAEKRTQEGLKKHAARQEQRLDENTLREMDKFYARRERESVEFAESNDKIAYILAHLIETPTPKQEKLFRKMAAEQIGASSGYTEILNILNHEITGGHFPRKPVFTDT